MALYLGEVKLGSAVASSAEPGKVSVAADGSMTLNGALLKRPNPSVPAGTAVDFDSLTAEGLYPIYYDTVNASANRPPEFTAGSGWVGSGMLAVYARGASVRQEYLYDSGGYTAYREKGDSGWGAWTLYRKVTQAKHADLDNVAQMASAVVRGLPWNNEVVYVLLQTFPNPATSGVAASTNFDFWAGNSNQPATMVCGTLNLRSWNISGAVSHAGSVEWHQPKGSLSPTFYYTRTGATPSGTYTLWARMSGTRLYYRNRNFLSSGLFTATGDIQGQAAAPDGAVALTEYQPFPTGISTSVVSGMATKAVFSGSTSSATSWIRLFTVGMPASSGASHKIVLDLFAAGDDSDLALQTNARMSVTVRASGTSVIPAFRIVQDRDVGAALAFCYVPPASAVTGGDGYYTFYMKGLKYLAGYASAPLNNWGTLTYPSPPLTAEPAGAVAITPKITAYA